MKILPKVTQLPDEPLARRHSPVAGDYSSYRSCCRWEFGFTCCLCFLHEGDLIEAGAESTGLVWIEHQELKSASLEKRDLYENCLLSCRFCNNGRSTRPNIEKWSGAKLLDPTVVAWSVHFELVDDQLRLKRSAEADRDADYTFRSYGLGARRKAWLRQRRRERMETLERTRNSVRTVVPRLEGLLARTTIAGDREDLVKAIQELRTAYRQALLEVVRYEAVPNDKPDSCRCAQLEKVLPPWLEQQLQDVVSNGSP